MNNRIEQAGNFIKQNKTPLLYVGGAIVIVAVGYTIVRTARFGVRGLFKDKSVGASQFKPLEFDKTKVTISDALANTYSNQLFNAMKDGGTDEDAIYAVLQKLQKKDDFLKVYNNYGKKSYYVDGEPTLSAWLFGYRDLDLVEWLREELGYANFLTYSLAKKTVLNAGLAF